MGKGGEVAGVYAGGRFGGHFWRAGWGRVVAGWSYLGWFCGDRGLSGRIAGRG